MQLLNISLLHKVRPQWLGSLHLCCTDEPRCSLFTNAPRGIHSVSIGWRPVPLLEDGSVEIFRRDAFQVQQPAQLPYGHLRDLPAISKWFLPTESQRGVIQLNTSYLEQFGSANVPLELSSAKKYKNQTEDIPFQRSEAPLGIFLRWAESADSQTRQRLYLAQAPLSNLPAQMKRDLPTPQIVSDAGKGDIYDMNLWLGVAPTYTPLHRDPNPNLFVQLAGQKIVRILPPTAGQDIFTAVQKALGRDASAVFRGEEMMEGEEERLLEGQIWGDHLANGNPAFIGSEATLNGGDGLFIPKGFWHSIRGVGTGITGSANWWFR